MNKKTEMNLILISEWFEVLNAISFEISQEYELFSRADI